MITRQKRLSNWMAQGYQPQIKLRRLTLFTFSRRNNKKRIFADDRLF